MATPGETGPRTERLFVLLQKALGHELPNQLLAIQGLARVLDMEAGGGLGLEAKDFLARLAAASQRTHELVRMLAEFVRAARVPAPEQPTALATALAQALMEMRQSSAACRIDYDLPKGDLLLWMPGPALHRVLVELLRHACQAAPDAAVQVGAGTTPDGIEFWIAHRGQVEDEAQLQRLLEPFAGRPPVGTGLELVLVRHLIEWWGGSLRVRCSADHGNRFIVTMPASRNHE
jgi:signal transduction histidine kinase